MTGCICLPSLCPLCADIVYLFDQQKHNGIHVLEKVPARGFFLLYKNAEGIQAWGFVV